MDAIDRMPASSISALEIAARGPLDRPLVFVTGAPRSGTSLVTKVLDSHPDAAVLMESILSHRRRHWTRPAFWDDPDALRAEVSRLYADLPQPVAGNKVCTPDVWSADDIRRFCGLFADFRIIFVVRDPARVAFSRLRREDYAAEFNEMARQMMLLDFRTRCRTYTSSWRQSIETYWKLRDGHPERVQILYYEDFCADFEGQLDRLCRFAGLSRDAALLDWYRTPHHDASGKLVGDLKYPDRPVTAMACGPPAAPGVIAEDIAAALPPETLAELEEALETIAVHRDLWRRRCLGSPAARPDEPPSSGA